MEVKDNRKIIAAQIKKLVACKAAPFNYYRDMSIRVLRKKKARNIFLLALKHKVKNKPKRHCDHPY